MFVKTLFVLYFTALALAAPHGIVGVSGVDADHDADHDVSLKRGLVDVNGIGANNNGNHDVSPKSKRQVGVVAGVDVDVLKRDLVDGIDIDNVLNHAADIDGVGLIV